MNDIEMFNTSLMKQAIQNKDVSFNIKSNLTNTQALTENSKSKQLGLSKANKSVNKMPPFYPASTQLSYKSNKKSIAENNVAILEGVKEKTTLYSTWTPLNDEKYNQKLFDERKQLLTKWFETWNETQRKIVIEEILNLCKPKQLFFTRDALNKISPVYHLDFTRILPRVICLYIMSFLDPRSLCRCAQVSWYWKMLSESDQLWIPKCLRFGWNLNYIPSSFENGIWKQFYIENIKALQYVPVKKASVMSLETERSEINLDDLKNGKFGFNRFTKSSISSFSNKSQKVESLKQPPWRANNSNPNHFYRFNYLDGESSNENLNSKKNNIKHNTSSTNV